LLGKGVGIQPEENIIVSPIEGTVLTILESKHAIGLISSEGVEILIHVGIDTVNLKGAPFELFVKEGDYVSVGQELMAIDFKKIKEKGYDDTVILIVTNSDKFTIQEKVGPALSAEELMTIN
jgi:PTS system beta-glucosides-specific IIC component